MENKSPKSQKSITKVKLGSLKVGGTAESLGALMEEYIKRKQEAMGTPIETTPRLRLDINADGMVNLPSPDELTKEVERYLKAKYGPKDRAETEERYF